MNRFAEETVRIEALVHIEGMVTDEFSYPDIFTEFCEALPERTDAQIYQRLPLLARYADGEYPEAEELGECLAMHQVRGFFVQAATPVREYHRDGRSFGYSWGYYHTEWLYARDTRDIERVCVKWARAQGAADLAKQRAETPAPAAQAQASRLAAGSDQPAGSAAPGGTQSSNSEAQ